MLKKVRRGTAGSADWLSAVSPVGNRLVTGIVEVWRADEVKALSGIARVRGGLRGECDLTSRRMPFGDTAACQAELHASKGQKGTVNG